MSRVTYAISIDFVRKISIVSRLKLLFSGVLDVHTGCLVSLPPRKTDAAIIHNTTATCFGIEETCSASVFVKRE